MWYKLINPGQSSTISVGKHLITKDSRFSVAYYSIDHGFSPPKWDLHITHLRLSDAANYQCHVITKDNRKSSRSNVKLIVEGKEKKRRISSRHHTYTQYLCEKKKREIEISYMQKR